MRQFWIYKEAEYWKSNLQYNLPSLKSVKIKEPEYNYSMNKLTLGIANDNTYLRLNGNNSLRVLLIGNSGSGKSYLTHAFIDRFAKSGGCVFIIDIKGEYLSLAAPVQEKFRKFLLKDEKPQGFDINSFYPRFLSNYSGYTPIEPYEKFIELNINKINKFNLLSMLGNLRESEEILINKAFGNIDKIKNFNDFISYIVKERGSQLLINKLLQLKKNNVFGDEHEFNIRETLKPGKINILNLRGVRALGRYLNIINSFIAIILREIYLAKENYKKIKNLNVLIVIDEIGIWFEHETMSPSSIEIANILRRGRSLGISFWASDQTKEKISPILFTQANYIFLPHNIDFNELKETIKQALPEEYDYPIPFNYKMSEIYYDMKKYKSGNRDWLFIDKINKIYKIFSVVSPLSWHTEEKEDPRDILKNSLNFR